MQTGSTKRLVAIVAVFLVILFLLMKLSPSSKSGHRKHTASKPKPVAAETGKSGALTPKLAPPAGAAGVPLAATKRVAQVERLSGPPKHDIFVRPKPPAKKSASSASTAGTSAKPSVQKPSKVETPKLPPPPLKLLGTVVADGSAAAVVAVGQKKLYVEPGQTIPYGDGRLMVAQITPEQVRCVMGDSVRFLQLAKF